MAADDLPFELIAGPVPDPAAHDPTRNREWLARRQPPPFLGNHSQAALRYRPSDELLLALNMALHTGSPLLLTGEPGTGKTQAADFVGAYFGIPVYKFLVKSTSTAQDLMYEFDAVGHLHWAQSDRRESAPGQGIAEETEAVRQGFLHKRALWETYETDGDAVVLIDEIDKASCDFPNDLLHELDQHSFPHPFDHTQWIKPRSGRPPLVIATSNEERRLPDAFLRRCIFHRIELTPALVEVAVESMAGMDGSAFPNLDSKTRDTARRRFWELREAQGLDKKPSTAELLTWLSILSAQRVDTQTLDTCRLAELPALGALIKDAGDLARLRHLFAREPKLDRARLKTLLSALLIKTPAQRQAFENLFSVWCPDREADWPAPAEPSTTDKPLPGQPRVGEAASSPFEPLSSQPPQNPFSKWLLPALVGLMGLAVLIWSFWPPSPVRITEPPEPLTQPIPTQPNDDPQLPDQPVNTVWSWRIDEIKPESVRVPNRLGPLPLALLGATALTLALGLWWRYRRRFPVIEPKPQPHRGFGWQPLPPPARDDTALIDTRSRRQLVWRIDQFIADDPTRRLNLPNTVDQTARAGGFVRFCFEPAVYERAIWFWLDRHLERRTPRDVATQLSATLRAVLGLSANPWQIDRILVECARPETRRRLINWLLRSEPLSGDALRSDSLARRALDWWQVRYAEADRKQREQENPLLPWQDSLASRRWQLEHALLQLYTDPEAAADRLTGMADEELREDIRDRLSEFAAADHRPTDREDNGERIYLTWRFASLPATTRHRLRELGFASGLYPTELPPLKRAPRLVLAVSLLATLALAAFVVAGYRLLTPNPPRLLAQDSVYDDPVLVSQTLRIKEPAGPNQYDVTLGSPKESVTLQEVPAGAEIPVNWHWAAQENPEQWHGSDSVLLRAGSLAQPIRACGEGWLPRSLAVITAPYTDKSARQLAIRLLDKGSADQVLLGTDWGKYVKEWLGPNPALNRQTQVLVILPKEEGKDAAVRFLTDHPGPWAIAAADNLADLARAVDFSGLKPIQQVPLPWRALKTKGDVRIYGGPETMTENGIEWISVCPGTFTMGSIKGEAMAYENEIVEPPRMVALSGFQIAATETTNRQYAQVVPDHKEQNAQPVVAVTWQQARSFCQKIGGDLPTEAQWEYAARGGSRTPWSFGDDQAQLGLYAWFGGNSNYQIHDVKQKLPNPLGLYDMHGNAWEWTRDWYDNYQAGTIVDPKGPNSGTLRVVRGGSFAFSPVGLRSAVRLFVDPVNWRGFGNFGFRCVRVPPPH